MSFFVYKNLKFKKMRFVISLLFFIFVLTVLYVLLATPEGKAYLPICLFHKFTGLHCPGCGGTRAVQALLGGDFVQALDYNIFFILVSPLLLMYIFQEWFFFVFSYRILFIDRLNSKIVKFVTIFCILFFILRNIPLYPFSLLAP